MKQKDYLKKIFEIQSDFNKDLINLSIKDRELKTKEFILALLSETTELLEEINWAKWKRKKDVISSNVSEEIIDIMKFLLNICILWGIDHKQFYDEFVRKSMVVGQRAKQKRLMDDLRQHHTPVCALDLDGTLVDYPRCWIDYVNKIKKTNFDDLFDMRNKLDKMEYLELKDRYRKSGIKQHLPMIRGAKRFVDKLSKLGYSIIIITKRPYKRYYRIFADTKISLDSNKIKYDAILFDDNKHKTIVSEFPGLSFIVEDNRRIANEISRWGYKVFLLNTKYNQGSIDKNVVRVYNYNEVINNLKREVE